MSRYIDAEWLLRFFEPFGDNYHTPLGVLRACIDDAPTIEPKHGEWVEKIVNDVKITVCSNCDKEPTFTHYYDSCGNYSLSDFCPNCGADMRGENNETDKEMR